MFGRTMCQTTRCNFSEQSNIHVTLCFIALICVFLRFFSKCSDIVYKQVKNVPSLPHMPLITSSLDKLTIKDHYGMFLMFFSLACALVSVQDDPPITFVCNKLQCTFLTNKLIYSGLVKTHALCTQLRSPLFYPEVDGSNCITGSPKHEQKLAVVFPRLYLYISITVFLLIFYFTLLKAGDNSTGSLHVRFLRYDFKILSFRHICDC